MSKHPQYDASDEAYAAARHFKKLLGDVQLPHEELDDMPDGAWAEAMGSVLSACKRGHELRLSTARAQATAAAEERLRAVRELDDVRAHSELPYLLRLLKASQRVESDRGRRMDDEEACRRSGLLLAVLQLLESP